MRFLETSWVQKEWLIRKQGAFAINRDGLGLSSRDQTGHYETWIHVNTPRVSSKHGSSRHGLLQAPWTQHAQDITCSMPQDAAEPPSMCPFTPAKSVLCCNGATPASMQCSEQPPTTCSSLGVVHHQRGQFEALPSTSDQRQRPYALLQL